MLKAKHAKKCQYKNSYNNVTFSYHFYKCTKTTRLIPVLTLKAEGRIYGR